VLLTCNETGFAALPQGQIVPVLADRGCYISSERSFYRVLHNHLAEFGNIRKVTCRNRIITQQIKENIYA
jgi:hypothetical protein